MQCIWEGDIRCDLDTVQLCCIIENLHFWILKHFRPGVSSCLDRWNYLDIKAIQKAQKVEERERENLTETAEDETIAEEDLGKLNTQEETGSEEETGNEEETDSGEEFNIEKESDNEEEDPEVEPPSSSRGRYNLVVPEHRVLGANYRTGRGHIRSKLQEIVLLSLLRAAIDKFAHVVII